MSSIHNGIGYYGLKERLNDTLTQDHFRVTLASGAAIDSTTVYARTGYLGFLMTSENREEAAAGKIWHLVLLFNLFLIKWENRKIANACFVY